MVTAIVLINTERGRVVDVAQQLIEIDGVSEVFSVAGRYDLVALLRVATNDEMASLVTGHLLRVDGVALFLAIALYLGVPGRTVRRVLRRARRS